MSADKHTEVAQSIADNIPSRVMDVNRKFAASVIARALANAEREGMKRAAEIIVGHWGETGAIFGSPIHAALKGARDRILSEAGEV